MGNILTPEFRASYANLFKAKRNDLNGKDEFSVVALFPKGANLDMLKAAAQKAIEDKWGTDRKKWPANMKSPFRKQEERAKNVDGEMIMPAGYEEGGIFITLKSEQRPQIVGRDMQEIIDSSEVYSGCYLRASVAAFAYDQKGNRGVSFGLRNIQKVRDGDALTGRSTAMEDFVPIAGAGGDDASGSADATGIFG